MPWPAVVGLVGVKVAMSMVFAGRYGWHRDELYYLASARHLELGYVDYPPVTPAIARLVRWSLPTRWSHSGSAASPQGRWSSCSPR